MARALVLGGGGVTGVAWELGILRGLEERGIRLAEADTVIGTSAGSVVAAKVTSGGSLASLYEEQLVPKASEKSAELGRWGMLRWAFALLTSGSLTSFGRKIGKLALKAKTCPEAERRAIIEARLPTRDWPTTTRLLITGVDAATGQLRVFDRESGVTLVDAVGASCAVPLVWPPVTIGGARYIDGGMRSAANADLAAGASAIVAIAPLTGGGGVMPGLHDQLGALRHAGARVIAVTPNGTSLAAIGNNLLDPARAPGAARAGLAQAESVADEIRAMWQPA